MKVSVSFDLDDADRRAIANYYGHKGLANRETCKTWLHNTARADLDGCAQL